MKSTLKNPSAGVSPFKPAGLFGRDRTLEPAGFTGRPPGAPWRPAIVISVVLATGFPVAGAEEKAPEFKAWLREHREKFPMIEMDRGRIPFAKVHELEPGESTLQREDRFYSGFRFETPDWLDGSVLWMFGVPGPSNAQPGFSWFVVPEQPSDKDMKLNMYRRPATRYHFFRELFPGCGSMLQQPIRREYLDPGSRYIVWISHPTPEIPELRFAMTVASERGRAEFGLLPAGYPEAGPNIAFRKSADLKPVPPKQLVAKAVEIKNESGIEAALADLERGLRANIDAGARFQDFWLAVWRESQLRSGRTDAEWAAALNLWMQERCLEFDATGLAVQLSSNAASALIRVHQYGSARTALLPFFDQVERRQLSLDPRGYPDAGPAFEELPEVRMREFPLEGKGYASYIMHSGFTAFRKEMPAQFSGSMQTLARLELMGGDWQRVIERHFWVCHWAEEMRDQIHEPEGAWYGNRLGVAGALEAVGLLELADEEYRAIIDFDWPDPYNNRSKLKARHHRLDIRRQLDGADAAMIGEFEAIHQETKDHPNVHSGVWESVAISKAACHAALGQRQEAEEILSRLADEGNLEARIARVTRWIRDGVNDPVETELLALLKIIRAWGRKLDEVRLYSLYADFLTDTDRLPEALAMRREAVRLTRSFNLFPKLPTELARLSRLLAKCGDAPAARAAADEAVGLSRGDERIPERIADSVAAILKQGDPEEKSGVRESPEIAGDLQPIKAMIVPLEDQPLRGRLTLSNPSARTIEGTLEFVNYPSDAIVDAAPGEVSVTLGTAGVDRLEKLRVEPGTYTVIDLVAEAGAFVSGELSVVWSVPGQKEQTSLWIIDEAESGVKSAVLEAGVFERNAFYGVPIHHHYQQVDHSGSTAALRAVCSLPARVELYDGDGRPIYIDATGNGRFDDPGDAVFQDADSDAFPDITLEGGEALIRLQVFPSGKLPEEGLKITLESKSEGQWLPFSEDTLQR